MSLLFARALAVAFCWGMFLLIPAAAFSQTNYYYFTTNGTEYPIIGSLPGDQVYPDVALNKTNGFVVWQDNITDGSGWGVSAMQLSGSGSTFRVNATGTNDQENARVAMLQKGGAVFVWQGGVEGFQHVYARFLSSSNTFLTATDVVVSVPKNNFQINPALAVLTNGNVIVVWQSFDEVSTNSLLDVYGQFFSPTGTPIGTNFLINQFTTYNQRNPTVAALANGGFVVAWISEYEHTNSAYFGVTPVSLPGVDVYARLYNNNAVAQTGEFHVNVDSNPCADPAVAPASDGSYMITWTANDTDDPTNSWDIYARSFTNSAGGSLILVNASNTYGDQYNPRISAIGGNYMIVFTSLGQDGDREGVYGQFVNENGSLIGNEFLVNTTTKGQQMEQTVASDGVQQFLAVWTSQTFTSDGFDLFAQRYGEAPLPAPFVYAPFTLSNSIYQPQLVVSWPVYSVSDYEVYTNGNTNSPAVTLTGNQWTMTAANGLTNNSMNWFAVDYVTTSGQRSMLSPWASGTTWSGCNWGGVPCEWMEQYYGTNEAIWPSATSPAIAGGPTLQKAFLTGANPTNSATWLHSALTRTSQGFYLNWNTQPGHTYQVQVTTNFLSWSNMSASRYEAGTIDSIYVGGSPGYYRVIFLQ